MIELLDTPKDIPFLVPLVKREIFYRLLSGEQGGKFRQFVMVNTRNQKVAQSISYLRANFMQNLHIEDLAVRSNMSVSTFHNHFRKMTAMSPLQYQKQLRLQEARRLMLSESSDATTAAYEVGYESPTQFSRKYKRLFGSSPIRDVARIRQEMG